MPASIILAAVGAQLTGVALAAATFAINFAASYVITRIFGQQASKQQDSGVRQQVPPSSTNSIPVVYGDAWMGGTFVDAVLTTDQQTMYYVIAISNISPNGQFTYDTTKFYYGDRLITFDGSDPTRVISLTDGAGNVDTKINGNLYINLYTSTTAGVITNVTGTAPSTFMGGGDIPAGLRWTGTRQMNGLAFAIVKLIYNRDAGTTSLQPITFKVKHALNGTGLAKPGDVLYDYLTQTYGGAVTAANVNSTACAALNTYSDATISYTPSGGGSSTQARYRINGVLDTGWSVLENVDKILTACDSWLAYQASTGQWAPVINKAESTGFAFNDGNIIGDIKVSVVDLASSINQIEVSFPFKDNKDQPEYVFLQTPSGLLYPNEPVNKYTTSFDLVNDSVQASYLANRILEQAREDLIVSFSTAYTGIQVDAGDVISITNADYGWSAKLFRVTKVQEASLPDGNLGARIECSEYNASVYDDGSITQFAPAPNSGISSVYYFPSLSAPTFSDEKPAENPPKFSVTCQLPSSGRVTSISLFYTTVASPTQTDWKIWATQLSPNSQPFAQGAAIKFTDVILGTDDYYFAFSVANEIGSSELSAMSAKFSWATVSSATFIASFQPAAILVPRTGGTPSFTGIVTQLFGSNATGPIEFVTSQTDADVAFVDNTWRIGGSDVTGNADITTTGGLVMGSITDGGSYAQWGAPTAMTTTGATLSVPVRYKDQNGNVTQYSASKVSFTFADSGTNGTRTARLQLYQWASSTPTTFPSGTSTYTWATATFTNPTLNGWSQTPGAGSAGQSLYSVIQEYADTATTATSTVTWTTSTEFIVGYAGDNGRRTAQLTLYKWSSSAPTTYPSGTSTYTWSNNTFTAPTTPNGWLQNPGAGNPGEILYSVTQSYSDLSTSSTSTVTWSTSTAVVIGSYGSNGIRTARLSLYQWASSAPSVFPSGTSTYTWSTATFTNPTLNGWTQTPTSGAQGETLYSCTQTYSDSSTTATSTISWSVSTSTIAGYYGINGPNGARTTKLTLYQWASSAPSVFPSGTSTYTWATGTFTNPTLNGWSQAPGTGSPGQSLYACEQIYSDTNTSSTSSVTWSTSSSLIIGAYGNNGTRIARLELYIWSSSAPTLFPSGTSTYTWSTGLFTNPATLNGWTQTPTSGQPGEKLYACQQLYSDSNTSSTSVITWSASTSYIVGQAGNNGSRSAKLELYKWSSTTPTLFPSGTSTYTWSTGLFTDPTLNSWTQTPGAGSPGQYLYACQQNYSDTNTTSTSVVTWLTSTAYIIGYSAIDGQNGTQSATPTLYQWAASIPGAPSGTSTYTWATNTFTPNLIGSWGPTPGTSPSIGYTLYSATVNLIASALTTTSTITWSSATISAVGYSGTNGASSRICYTSTDLTSLNSTPTTITTAGSGSFPAAGSWGATIGGVNQNWVATPPTIIAGESVYQSDGVYDPVTGNTVWNVPYLSTLKVGSLSAITVNTGALTVQDALTINTLGHIKGGQTAYNTGTGFFLGYSGTAYKFSIGSSTQSLTWDGSAMTVTGNIYANGAGEFTGNTSTAFALTTALKANSGGTADIGVLGQSKTTGVSFGVYGYTNSSGASIGVQGVSTTSAAIGVVAKNTSSGTALSVEGPMTMSSTTLVTNLNADQLDGKHASAFVEIASGTTNGKYLYYVNNNTAPTDPNNRAAWIKVSTNDGAVVWFPGYV